MENAEPAPVDPVPPVDTDPVQTLAEDLLTKAPKKRRLLSERQKEALRKGREIRWPKRQTAGDDEPPSSLDTENQRVGQIPRLVDPHLQSLLDPNTFSSESDSDSSSSDEDGSKKKRKAKKLKKSIPKAVRRRLDRYLKSKMEDVKAAAQREREQRYEDEDEEGPPMPTHPPVLQRKSAHYYNNNAPLEYPLSFV